MQAEQLAQKTKQCTFIIQGGKYSYANTTANNKGSLSKNGKTTKGYDKAISTALKDELAYYCSLLVLLKQVS